MEGEPEHINTGKIGWFFLVRSCHHITPIKCLKGHKSLVSLLKSLRLAGTRWVGKYILVDMYFSVRWTGHSFQKTYDIEHSVQGENHIATWPLLLTAQSNADANNAETAGLPVSRGAVSAFALITREGFQRGWRKFMQIRSSRG